MNIASWAVIDMGTGMLVAIGAFAFSPAWAQDAVGELKHARPVLAANVLGVSLVLAGILFNLQLEVNRHSRLDFLLRCVGCAAIAVALHLLVLYFVWFSQVGRWIIVQSFVYILAGLYGGRVLVVALGEKYQRPLLVVGELEFQQWLHDNINRRHLPFRIVAVVRPISSTQCIVASPVTGSSEVEDLPGLDFNEFNVREIVTEDSRRLPLDLQSKLGEFLYVGNQVSDGVAFAERNFELVPLDQLNEVWFQQIDLRLSHPFYHRIKRVVDVLASIVVGIVALPVMLIAALCIKMDGGPLFYAQDRVGKNGSIFRIRKLRTMRVDAEAAGPKWADARDARVTAVGRFLRLTRIDEVPQVWNVLNGEMSFIGPRPERPEFTQQLETSIPFYRYRHLVKPGITGWAQVNFQYGASVADTRRKLELDLYYVKKASLLLDLQILIRTIASVTKGSR